MNKVYYFLLLLVLYLVLYLGLERNQSNKNLRQTNLEVVDNDKLVGLNLSSGLDGIPTSPKQ